jgi:hypothetical protein
VICCSAKIRCTTRASTSSRRAAGEVEGSGDDDVADRDQDKFYERFVTDFFSAGADGNVLVSESQRQDA